MLPARVGRPHRAGGVGEGHHGVVERMDTTRERSVTLAVAAWAASVIGGAAVYAAIGVALWRTLAG